VAVSRASRASVFLDKDGTLIEDLPYNVDPLRIRLAPGARAGVRMLGRAGLPIVIVTNQSGVARGYFTEADLHRLADHLRSEVSSLGATLDGFYFCPHLPDGINEFAIECECRKPLPGLIARAARDLGLEPRASWFVGDTWMDVAAGRAAGCRTIMVGPEHRTADELPFDRRPDHAVPDLLAAARIIVGAGAETDGAEMAAAR
jgi:D-glycero-D-manno-heptose 1,7-bisphosphate phosphatase